MADAPATDTELKRELAAAQALTRQLAAVLDAAVNRLSPGVEQAVQAPFKSPLIGARPGDWRGTGRRGRPSNLDTDAELSAFVRARADDMPFKDLAAEIAARFPPGRRASASALHRWWHRQRAAGEDGG